MSTVGEKKRWTGLALCKADVRLAELCQNLPAVHAVGVRAAQRNATPRVLRCYGGAVALAGETIRAGRKLFSNLPAPCSLLLAPHLMPRQHRLDAGGMSLRQPQPFGVVSASRLLDALPG